jgi:hypothetical protein
MPNLFQRKPKKFAELDIIFGEVVNTLWEKIASLNDEIGSLRKTNKELNERVSKLETSNASDGGTTPGQPLFSSLFTTEQNIIVSGIPEAPNGSEEEKAAHDKTSVEALLTALGTRLTDMKSHKRIKTNYEKPNLILIEFHRFDSADMVAEPLSNAKKLRTNETFKGVYINRDMTKAERIIEKRLRDESNRKNEEDLRETGDGEGPCRLYQGRRFHWGIRLGEVRRIFDKPT